MEGDRRVTCVRYLNSLSIGIQLWCWIRARAVSIPTTALLALLCGTSHSNDTEEIEQWGSSAQDGRGRRLLSSAPEVVIGDRLFFETRFAQYFFASSRRQLNGGGEPGDAVVAEVARPGKSSLRGPFRGRSVSCRHCHLGDDFIQTERDAQRTYCDFLPRSNVPLRSDPFTRTVRNTPPMVDLGLAREVPELLHYDGQFSSPEQLIVETLVGREMGWLLDERQQAIKHIARVIREDKGINPRNVIGHDGAGIPYNLVLAGADPSIPPELVIPKDYRIDVRRASDERVLGAVARLIHAYIDSIRFGIRDTYRDAGSPYDRFLAVNSLPTEPVPGESAGEYAKRLAREVGQRSNFIWVVPDRDGAFMLHDQPYGFGPLELKGLKLFLRKAPDSASLENAGNCAACHPPPLFTDHRFHNTGAAQDEYDSLFGEGAFARLSVPTLAQRRLQPEIYLPATPRNPGYSNRFRSIPEKQRPGFADLGVWNVYANPDFPSPQRPLTEILCSTPLSAPTACAEEALLPLTIALFKTPSIRDLGHSEPYMHSGAFDDIESVVDFYVRMSRLARVGAVRNGSSHLLHMRIDQGDIESLSAFLRSLNEDYH